MKRQTVTKPKEEHFLKAREEMEQLSAEIAERVERLRLLRHKMADIFHPGDHASLHGTRTTKNIYGYEVKVERKLSISLPKDAIEQLEEENPELLDEVAPKRTERKLNDTAARKKLDELEDYATVKQGLPTVTFKRIEG